MSGELLEDLRTTTRHALAMSSTDVVDELDLAGLLVDPGRGGLGMGDREMALVSTELGRAFAPSSFLPTTVLAATLLAHLDTDAAAETLAGLAAGEKRFAVALAGCGDASPPQAPSITASPTTAGGWLLNGTAWAVTTPSRPHALVTVAATDDGVAILVAEIDHVGRKPADQLDATCGLIEVSLHDSPARLLAAPATAAGAITAAYRRGLLSVAAQQTGGARACLEMAVEYAKTRSQFGSPIGAFQAIKHRCVEVLLDVALAEAVLDTAIDSTVSVDAELAFIVATRAAVSAADSCIHIHGGIGFTWEHSAHRYLRRARVNATLMGATDAHRDAIAASAGLGTERKV